MGVEEIKRGIAALSASEQNEVTAFLFHFRHVSDPDFQEQATTRLNDGDPSHWLKPDEFEHELDRR